MQPPTSLKLLQGFIGMVKYYGGVTFLLHPEFDQSNRHLSQKTIGSYVRKS
jgi:hypothetical protein